LRGVSHRGVLYSVLPAHFGVVRGPSSTPSKFEKAHARLRSRAAWGAEGAHAALRGWTHRVLLGTSVYRRQEQRLRLCGSTDGSTDDGSTDSVADHGHADRQRCALAGSHAVGQRSARVPWPLQARSRRSPSRRPQARRGCGTARRARRMDARLPRPATRAPQVRPAHRQFSSARCQRHWATCGASAG
jgi:hypothetical protein